MGLRERFTEIINNGIPYIGDAHEAPLFVGRETLIQQCLDAVCAEWRMHDFPRHHAKYGGDDTIRVARISGPCRICGVKHEP